jgi:hypothetical protein
LGYFRDRTKNNNMTTRRRPTRRHTSILYITPDHDDEPIMFNRIPANSAASGIVFLGRFLKGHISLKNWTQRVILKHDTTSFKRTCFLTTLKVLPDDLYVSNGLPYIAALNNNRKQTVEFWMHTKSARATLIFVNI